MTLLIVDDERDIRESLQEYFEDEGLAVRVAANGRDALDVLAEDPLPCLVILDLIMPIMSGNELYQAMQNDPRLVKVPVIISTSDPSRAPSGVLIMKKPIDLDLLLATVRQYCSEVKSKSA